MSSVRLRLAMGDMILQRAWRVQERSKKIQSRRRASGAAKIKADRGALLRVCITCCSLVVPSQTQLSNEQKKNSTSIFVYHKV
jgi:hypothetical protein